MTTETDRDDRTDRMTRTQAVHDFFLYYADLSADARAEGYRVDREQEWSVCISDWLNAGRITAAEHDAWLHCPPR